MHCFCRCMWHREYLIYFGTMAICTWCMVVANASLMKDYPQRIVWPKATFTHFTHSNGVLIPDNCISNVKIETIWKWKVAGDDQHRQEAAIQ